VSGLAPPSTALTGAEFWDRYWSRLTLPREHRHAPRAYYLNAILDVFDRWVPKDTGRTAAEVGGAPGQYLAYMHRSLGYRVTCIDFSETGCERTLENFRLLGIPGDVIQADITGDVTELPAFDLVYSLGLIEHFTDRRRIVANHARLVRPGGYLVLGVPNFRGPTGWFMRILGPDTYATHVIEAMDLARWAEFEEPLGLRVVWKDYVGGFEPSIFARREDPRPRTLVPYLVARGLTRLLSRRFGFLRRINGPRWSGYAMAVYQVGEPQANQVGDDPRSKTSSARASTTSTNP
jgi:SAM-dependent methyltransferase